MNLFGNNAPAELIDRFNIPFIEYPRRCIEQINDWQSRKQELLEGKDLKPEKLRNIVQI